MAAAPAAAAVAMPVSAVQITKKEKDKLAKELASAGAETVSAALANGIAFKATYIGIVTISAAAGGGPMVESLERLVKEEPDRWPAYVIMSADDFFVVHQKGGELITGHSLADIQYMGPVPDAGNVFGCVKRTAPLDVRVCVFLESAEASTEVLKMLAEVFTAVLKGRPGVENPVDYGMQSGMRRRLSTVGHKEVIEREPWFVGSASSAVVEKGLEAGMVGDYVVRESVSTPGAYVLMIKLSKTEFIQQKIQKTGSGMYAIDGQAEKFATLGKLIASVKEAKRPAGDTVLRKTKKDTKRIDVRTDVKAFDALYLGSTLVYERRDITIATGKDVVKKSVMENSEARKKLKSAMAKSKAGKRHEVLKEALPNGSIVMDENPVTIVLTPRHVRIVERATGEQINRFFIRSIPFTYEAPGRQGVFDKFALITKDPELGQVECHIVNVLKGYGHLLAEAIFFYIDQAEAIFNEKEVKAHNPFAAQGERIASPPKLFAKQIHRADIEPVSVIGAGQFGEVWKGLQAMKQADGTIVKVQRAIKLLKGGASTTDRNEFVREAEIMLDFEHDNVLQLVGVAVQQSPWLTVLEFMCYGDLQKLVRSCKTKQLALERGEMLDICAKVCRGCGYIISLRLVHMDIAARNVLVGAKNTVKVADFGLTRPMDKGQNYYRLKERLTLSVKWSAYEALRRKMFNEKSDVWSFGICAWEVFSYGDVPYRTTPLTQVAAEMAKGTRPTRPPGCPADVWKYISNCWNVNVDKRWDFAQAGKIANELLDKYPPPKPARDIGKVLKAKKVELPVSV